MNWKTFFAFHFYRSFIPFGSVYGELNIFLYPFNNTFLVTSFNHFSVTQKIKRMINFPKRKKVADHIENLHLYSGMH